MEKLAESYKHDGMVFVLRERTDRKAWYECKQKGYTIHEVFLIKVYPAGEMFGRMYPEREAPPCNEDFGNTAWCTTSGEDRAKSAYENLDSVIAFKDTDDPVLVRKSKRGRPKSVNPVAV